MLLCIYFLLILSFRKSDGHYGEQNGPLSARRILRGMAAGDTRPYMVYLRAAPQPETPVFGRVPAIDPYWLCGGVIIEPSYILTSAACIEDMEHFYVVSGTHKWLPASETNACIENGATRAVWKCVPKTYNYDGKALNNIQWMVNDIAVVMVADRFNFEKRVIGCDFIPQMVSINNISKDLEEPGTRGSIAGWGSIERYSDPADFISAEKPINRNSPDLLEADILMVPKSSCKNQWIARYHEIIDKQMICGMDIGFREMSEACEESEVYCRHLYENETEDSVNTRRGKISEDELLQSLARVKKRRKARRNKAQRRLSDEVGGFCENDHGGPLTVGAGRTTVVVGIITAYRTMNKSTKCVGPFLYTSVWNNRNFIHCAVYKDNDFTCRAILRSCSTILDFEDIRWKNIKWRVNEEFPTTKSRIKKRRSKARKRARTDLINFTLGMS